MHESWKAWLVSIMLIASSVLLLLSVMVNASERGHSRKLQKELYEAQQELEALRGTPTAADTERRNLEARARDARLFVEKLDSVINLLHKLMQSEELKKKAEEAFREAGIDPDIGLDAFVKMFEHMRQRLLDFLKELKERGSDA